MFSTEELLDLISFVSKIHNILFTATQNWLTTLKKPVQNLLYSEQKSWLTQPVDVFFHPLHPFDHSLTPDGVIVVGPLEPFWVAVELRL